MILSKRSKFGYTLEQVIEQVVGDLHDDEKDVGLMVDIVRNSFGLHGIELTEGVRAILLALTRAGARPGVYGRGIPQRYIPLPGYGETPEQITDTIMRQLQESNFPGRYEAGCMLVLPEWFDIRWTPEQIALETEELQRSHLAWEAAQKKIRRSD